MGADGADQGDLQVRIQELEQQLAEERDEHMWDLKAAKESNAQALRKLEEEIARLKQDASSAGQGSPEEVRQLTDRAMRAEQRVAELLEEQKRSSSLALGGSGPPPLDTSLLRRRAEGAEKERDSIRDEKLALERKLAEAEEKLRDAPRSPPPSPVADQELSSLREQLSATEKENARLTSELRDKDKEIAELASRLDAAAGSAEERDRLAGELEQARQQAERLQGELKSREADAQASASAEGEVLRRRISELEGELNKLHHELAEQAIASDQKIQEAGQLGQAVEEARQREAQLAEKLTGFEQENQLLKEKLAAAESSLDEEKAREVEAGAAKQPTDDQDALLERIAELERERDELRSRVESQPTEQLQQENQDLRGKLETLEQERDTWRTRAESDAAGLLEQENQFLREKLSALEQERETPQAPAECDDSEVMIVSPARRSEGRAKPLNLGDLGGAEGDGSTGLPRTPVREVLPPADALEEHLPEVEPMPLAADPTPRQPASGPAPPMPMADVVRAGPPRRRGGLLITFLVIVALGAGAYGAWHFFPEWFGRTKPADEPGRATVPDGPPPDRATPAGTGHPEARDVPEMPVLPPDEGNREDARIDQQPKEETQPEDDSPDETPETADRIEPAKPARDNKKPTRKPVVTKRPTKRPEKVAVREEKSLPSLKESKAEVRKLIAAKRLEDASKLLADLAKRHPRDAGLRYLLGRVLLALGDRKAAVEALEKAIDLAPRMAEAHHDLGAIYLQLGRKEEACDALGEFLHLKPSHPTAPGVRALLKKTGCP